MSVKQRVILGAAIAAVPLGIVGGILGAAVVYLKIRDASDRNDRAREKGFSYDVTGLQQIDPKLVTYRQAGKIDTMLQSPRAMALDRQGKLLIAAGAVIRRFNPDGSRTGADINLANQATCLATAADGKLYVGMRDHVDILSPEGQLLASWQPWAATAYISGLAIGNGNVYAADSGRLRVLRCDMAGQVLQEFGRENPALDVPGLIAPSPHIQVALAPDGLVWVSNPGRFRLEAYRADGHIDWFWGHGRAEVGGNDAARSGEIDVASFLGCCNPADFLRLPDGRFITAEKGIARVKMFSAGGVLEGVVAPPQFFAGNNAGLALAADDANRIFVLERGTATVRIFVPKTQAAAVAYGQAGGL